MRLMRHTNYLQIPMNTASVFIVNSFFIEYLYKNNSSKLAALRLYSININKNILNSIRSF